VRSYTEALAAFLGEGGGWAELPSLRDGRAADIASRLDALLAEGRVILPAPSDVLNAFRLTPLEAVKVVILGQDPYPTPGDAHGLAFSVARGLPLPRSLANIFREMRDDIGAAPASGNLSPWAAQGVLLLNSVLSVEAGQAGGHRRLGWQALTDEAIAAVAARLDPTVFILWGADAQAKRGLIDATRHLVIEGAHPSPLSARRGFFGSRPFGRANAFLREQGRAEVDWSSSG
jgi:uracil-DNA glycosylase